MRAANKVLGNTAIMYLKSVVTIFITLYTVRLVLKNLGANDFGLFNVVGGVVTMLSFLNSAMTTSTQRYLSHAIGSQDFLRIRKLYSNSVLLHLLLGLLLILVFEIVGYWMVNYKLVIDSSRIVAANYLLQFSIISSFFSIVSVPNDAAIVSKENMTFVAILGVFEVILNLILASLLSFFNYDKLITYGFGIMLIAMVIRVIKWLYVKKTYEEFTFQPRKYFDKKMLLELNSYAGWNIFGSISIVGKNQGLAIIFNLFFGTVVNAAYAVTNQVSSQILFFSRTLLQTMNPQIMQSEGSGDRKRMIKLSFLACKYGYLLVAFIGLPAIFEMDKILNIWLKDVPDYSVLFCRLIIVSLLINQLTIGLQTAIQATGQIKVYQIVVGAIQLLNLPIVYLLFKFGYAPYYAMICYCVMEFISCVFRFLILKSISSFTIFSFFKDVLRLQMLPTLMSVGICVLIVNFFSFDLRFLLTFAASIIGFFIVILLSLTVQERELFDRIFSRVKLRLK